ncbi:MAG TPA: Rieske 2Fe-2S domain-containing protein [Chloroflexota bacterium]|nr:Rieske 2Fe-2S domain-containing protein [Chloroflexota bacterium]
MALDRVAAHPDHTDFAYTGPGTLAGRYMRTFWQPVYVAKDLPAGRAVPIEIMGEEFTMYRGEGGQPHLVAFRCAHRGTQLSTGWVEGDCIRCFYHGWKYDAIGQCIEQPAEDASFAAKIRIGAYPIQEYLGLVFAYLGEGDPPPLPRYPHIEERDGVVDAGRGTLPYNYFNQVENSVDEVHVAFVHRDSPFSASGLNDVPRVRAEETEYGLEVRAIMPEGVRIVHLLMPTTLYVMVYPFEGSGWRDFLVWRVPIDDASFHTFFLLCASVTGEAAQRYLEQPGRVAPFMHDPSIAQVGESVLHGDLAMQDVADRRSIVALQDYISQKGQGVVADRAHERLGRSDASVILLRQIWQREVRALAQDRPLKQWRVPGSLEPTSGV